MPQLEEKLTNEYRVRLQLDNYTTCTFTSSDENKLKQHIKKVVPDANFEKRQNGTLITYQSLHGGTWEAWITQYSLPESMAVETFNTTRQKLKSMVA